MAKGKDNFFIGIGGTGSRVAEALVFLSAAGFGPERLSIIIVDPDRGNGNLDRTQKLIMSYSRCFAALADVRRERAQLRRFGTEIRIEDPERLVWTVFDKETALRPETTTLESILALRSLRQREPAVADLVELLYSPEELGMVLTEGFRGHPSIGAAVMAQTPEKDSAFKPLWDAIKEEHSANDIGVFLVGSVFGGTGAAGVPTFASEGVLKAAEGAALGGGKNKVVLGGALVLPYFSFKVDEGGERREKDKTFMTADRFAQATKAALAYYASEDKLAFDEFFLVGDSLAQDVGKFATGKGDQKNLPHYIEVVTALAALDFFRANERRKPDDVVPQKVFLSQRADRAKVEWDSFPVTREVAESTRLRKDFRERLISMTVFAYSLASYGNAVVQELGASDPEVASATWLRDGFEKNDGPRTPANRERLKEFTDFAVTYLQWLADMCLVDEATVRLFNPVHLTADKLRDWQKDKKAIGSLVSTRGVRQLDIGTYRKDFLEAATNLNDLKKFTAVSGAGRCLYLFSAAADAFTVSNYGGM
ncbi:MAG TPA: hypothetical protein PLL76_09100 [Thermoanaerobaculia bacterium]|jgi:hypothetical protein|nr:hypothetical protein [Thermoanaerobaculia bacterium]HQP86401.1 hypothetical protein [Thermoanaerobaculia bacterium]